jgi:sec-independent protein translocase protein TatA
MGLFDNPWHILIVLLVLVLLFGSAKLPKAAKSMGEAMRIFKKEAQKLHDDDPQPAAQAQSRRRRPRRRSRSPPGSRPRRSRWQP